MSLLTLRDVIVAYRGAVALDGLSLDVGRGEIVGLIGQSGSGKSTAALAAIDLLPEGATRMGQVLIDDVDPATLPPAKADARRGRSIGMIFQDPLGALNPLMTIGAQVAEALRLTLGLGRRAARAETALLLERVGLPRDRVLPGRYPHQLSGGQRQRVGIAIAIAGNPGLLIADEPTSALDATTQAQVIALLVDLVRERGMGLLLISHDLALVAGIADRIAVLKDGRLVEVGTTHQILTAPRDPYTRLLLERSRCAPDRSVCPARSDIPILEVEGLSRSFGTRRPLFGFRPPIRGIHDIGFRIMPGETLGIVGESGAGKTTLLRTILALDRPDAGTVRIGGGDVHRARGSERSTIRRRVQAVFQDPAASLDPRQTVAAIVAEPLHLLAPRPDATERRRRVIAALDTVGLGAEVADRRPHAFSGGQRQRIALARALILEPVLIVLDEAVSALDAAVRADILDLLARLSRERGMAYLFVSHDLGVMAAITDRLIVMKDGRIVEQGPTASILANPADAYTRQLIEAAPDLDRVIARRFDQA